MTAILLILACTTEPRIPEGEWANLAPAVAERVVPHPAGQLVDVTEADLTFRALLPAMPEVHVGDHLLLGRGPAVVLDAEHGPGEVVRLDEVAVVTPEVALIASAPPDLPSGVPSVQQLHEERAERAGTTVRAGGRIVKASMDVFDTNWYHVRDGTGAAASEDHDLTFTSDAVFLPGQVVVLEGTLTADHDLGFGYFYPVILQGPSVFSVDGVRLSGASEPAAVEAGRSGVSSASAPSAPPAAVETLPTHGPAPRDAYDVHGLVLGTDGDDAFDAWVDGRPCERAPALARRTVHTTCRGVEQLWTGSRRPVDVLAVRAEEADALHHVSATRSHPLMVEALDDLARTQAALEARLGAPHEVHGPEAGQVPEGPAAFRATWRFDELLVEVSLMRFRPTGPVLVRERTVLDGVEASLPDRGIGVHGAGARSTTNPHRDPDAEVAAQRER